MELQMNCCGMPALPKSVEIWSFPDSMDSFSVVLACKLFPVSKIKFTPKYWLTNPLCLHPRIGFFFILAPSRIRLLQRMWLRHPWLHHCFRQGESDADVSIWDNGVVWCISITWVAVSELAPNLLQWRFSYSFRCPRWKKIHFSCY